MENLKKSFEKIYSKYSNKKFKFKSVIAKWNSKNNLEMAKKAQALLDEAEVLATELKENFIPTLESQPDKNVVYKKLKEFKSVYKKLVEITKPTWRQWIEAIVLAGSVVFILRTFIFGLYHVPTGSAEPTILVGDRLWGNKMAYYLSDVKRGDSVIFDNPEFIYDKSNPINYYWQKYIGFPIPLLGLSAGPDNWVKRVIAVPGDVIEGRVEDGKTVIYRNGEKLDETSFVNPYPLIRLIKTTGFFNFESVGPLMIPSFLRKQLKPVYYTYDPSKSFEDQPFYDMKKEEVLKGYDGTPDMRIPYSPESKDVFGPIRLPKGKYWVMGDSRKNSQDSRFWGFLDEDLIHGRASFIIYSVDSEEPLWLFELLKHPIDFWTKKVRWNRFFKNIK